VWRGERQVLSALSFAVAAGECFKVTGPNGIGKTTLLRVLCGLLVPESGETRWRGQAIGALGADYCAEIAYLGHSNALKTDLTSRENLRCLVGVRRALGAGDISDALEHVGVADCAELPARVLSAGQRRRLALARLWLWGAALWVLDEPATNLDTAGQQLVESMIRDQMGRGGVVVVATHQRILEDAAGVRRLELT
jgi:heme exporter protein A